MFPIATISWIDAARQRPYVERTVMIHCPVSDDPVWIGYWDGETWRDVDGAELGPKFVDHWAEFPEPPAAADPRSNEGRAPSLRTLQDEWREYRDACYPDGCTALQNRETHQAFMAGALVAYLAIAACSTKPEAEARAFVDARMRELIAFDNARRAAMKGRR